jgi:hypothetical protein
VRYQATIKTMIKATAMTGIERELSILTLHPHVSPTE